MKDEIKETLYVLKHIVIGRASRLTSREADKLLDYITNLQEERDMYKESFETMSKNYFEEKAKIDKAIEYINENKHLSMFADCREPEEDWNYDLEINPRDLLNILKGE